MKEYPPLNLPNEKWKHAMAYSVSGEKHDFTGYYMISNLGRIKSMSRDVHFTDKIGNPSIRKTVDKILTPDVSKAGYYRITLSNDIISEKVFTIHRIVISTFKSKTKIFESINHEDGIKSNNTPQNLKWCTHKYNVVHATENKLNIPKRGWDDNQSKAISFELNGYIKKFGSIGVCSKEVGIKREILSKCAHSNISVKRGRYKGANVKFI